MEIPPIKALTVVIEMTVPQPMEGELIWYDLNEVMGREFYAMLFDGGMLGMERIRRIYIASQHMISVAHWLRGWSWFGRLVNTCRTLYFAQAGGFCLRSRPCSPPPKRVIDTCM